MVDSTEPDPVPFWQSKRLEEMTESEWESICDGCGRCCLETLVADDTHEIYPLDVACTLLDPATIRCTDYLHRLSRGVGCLKVAPDPAVSMPWLPPTCGYRRIHSGKPLDWWHPLVSGDPDTVRRAGISAVGRFVPAHQAGPWEFHTIEWPLHDVTHDPSGQWVTAMFGGVNASVPTPYGVDSRVNLDLMATHCLWLLANGCHGLAVLDKVGEVASLAVDERIAVLEGLLLRGVPASKLLAGIGPASVADGARIAARVSSLGIRGVMLTVSGPPPRSARIMPHSVLSGPLRELLQSISGTLHVYLSFSVRGPEVAACLTALDTFIAQTPTRLRGIRDETPGCPLGLAALEHFRGSRFEVYTADDMTLAKLIEGGGAGLMSPGPNLFGRLCAAMLQAGEADQRATVQRTITSACDVLRSHPAVAVIKTLLAHATGMQSWERMRFPLRPLKPADRIELFRLFDATGIRVPPVT